MSPFKGRGRLSSLDLLPGEAEADVIWAMGELRARKRLQTDILDSFNTRLAVKGLGPISASAFGRAAMRLNRMSTRLEEAREIAGVLANKFEDGGDEQLTLLVSETIKMIIYETVERYDDPRADGKSAEMVMNLAKALQHAEQAKKISAETRAKVEQVFMVKAVTAIDAVAKTRGLTAETVSAIKDKILGRAREPILEVSHAAG